MASKRVVRSLLILLLIIPLARAQSPSPEAPVSAKDQKKARDEREKKALAVLEEIIGETQSLKLPENRIRIQMAMADVLWPRNEQRARSLFKDAVASLVEITAAVDSGDPECTNPAHLPLQLRQEMLQVVAKYDARIALDFLRATRPAAVQQRAYSQPNVEAQLEMRLASEIAAKDTKEALRIGEETLKYGVDSEVMNLL